MPLNTRRFPFVTQDTDQARLPVALLSGFLGSGKTTLVNALLRDPRMANTAVAVNEFGEIPLDHDLIDHGADRTVVLANGCLCCNLSGDMETAVMRLFSRRENNEVPAFQRLIVEPSGLSDPAPIAQAILRNPVMSRALRLTAIVTTIDLLFAETQLARHPETRKQIALADRLVLTKPDLAPDAQPLRAALQALNPTAPILTAEHGVVDPALLFPADFLSRDATPSLPAQRSAFLAEAVDPAHATRVESLSLTADTPLAAGAAFDTWLRGIRLDHADQLLRVKAMLDIAGADGPVVVQGVHHVINAPVLLRAWPGRRSAVPHCPDRRPRHHRRRPGKLGRRPARHGRDTLTKGETTLRAIDVHVHPMNDAYVKASGPFMPAAQRMFKGKFAARPDSQIAEDFRRDDCLAIPIAWDAEHGAAGGVYANEELAALIKAYPDVFLPGWAMVDPWRGRKGLEEIEHAIKDLGLHGREIPTPGPGLLPQRPPVLPDLGSAAVPGRARADPLRHHRHRRRGTRRPRLQAQPRPPHPQHRRCRRRLPAPEHRRRPSRLALDRGADRGRHPQGATCRSTSPAGDRNTSPRR